MSAVQNNDDLRVSVFKPLFTSPGSVVDFDLPADYTHTIEADGGFYSASFTVGLKETSISDWVGNLGGHVEVNSRSGIVWEGFINSMTLRYGASEIEIGPFLDIVNVGTGKFTTIRWDTNFPVGGDASFTPEIIVADSIPRFGRSEIILSMGETDPTTAQAALELYLAENSVPRMENAPSRGGGGISMKVNLRGYETMLDRYYYTQVNSADFISADAKILRVIEADPNEIFQPIASRLIYNPGSLLVSYEDGERKASDIIKECVSSGDASNNRWLFYIAAGRICHYEPIPTTYSYRYDAYRGILTDINEGDMKPWEVKPGKWCRVEGLPYVPLSLKEVSGDAGAIFLESVTYTAPYNLDFTNRHVRRADQALARLGLGMW